MAALSLCLILIVIAFFVRGRRPGESSEGAAAAADSAMPVPSAAAVTTAADPALPAPSAVTVTATPAPAVLPTPEPTAAPVPESSPTPAAPTAAASVPARQPEQKAVESAPPQKEAPVSEGSAAGTDSDDWFSDAVFIGDSRMAGFRLYSGITSEATFLDHTGLTVYEVKDGKKVIRRGDKKISVLDALAEGTYGKVYIALGINELGYFNPSGFAKTFGEVVDAIREVQPDARIYIQSLIPVNAEKCKANDIPYYITNDGIVGYNAALQDYFSGKDVYLLRIPEGLVDENGALPAEYSADGVHLQKSGYQLWLNYLASHTAGD